MNIKILYLDTIKINKWYVIFLQLRESIINLFFYKDNFI